MRVARDWMGSARALDMNAEAMAAVMKVLESCIIAEIRDSGAKIFQGLNAIIK